MDDRRLLVTIRGKGDLSPLYMVHSLAGELTWMPHLVRRLDERRPLYGFAAPGLNAKGPFFNSLEGMAAGYLAAVRTVQPRGPYLFGGYSFGGIVAYEMARQAQAAGERVDGLVLVDSYTTASSVMPALRRWVGEGILIQSVCNLLALDWNATALLEHEALPPGDPEAQLDAAVRHLLAHCTIPHGYEALKALLEKCRDAMAMHTELLAAYRPQPPRQPLDALLIHNTRGFVSAENPLRLPPVPEMERDPDHGWSHYLLAAPEQVGLATEHFLMMRPPQLDRVADAISTFLNRRGGSRP